MSVQFNFEHALDLLRRGKTLRRAVWCASGIPVLTIMDIANGKRILNATDILASDWMLVEKPTTSITGDVTFTAGAMFKFENTAFKATRTGAESIIIELIAHNFSVDFHYKSFRALQDLLNAPWKA